MDSRTYQGEDNIGCRCVRCTGKVQQWMLPWGQMGTVPIYFYFCVISSEWSQITNDFCSFIKNPILILIYNHSSEISNNNNNNKYKIRATIILLGCWLARYGFQSIGSASSFESYTGIVCRNALAKYPIN